MQEIRNGKNHKVSWYDDDQTILLLDVFSSWTWGEAQDVIWFMNDRIAEQPHDVYTVFYFSHHRGAMLPHGFITPNLGRALCSEMPNEKLIVLAGGSSMGVLQKMVNIVGRAFDIKQAEHKIRFARSLDEALTLIEAVKESVIEKQ